MDYFESQDYRERIELMFYYRQLGMSLARIADKWGLSRERVRCILNNRERRVSTLSYQNDTSDEDRHAPALIAILGTHRPGVHALILASLTKKLLDT